jgi:two-component system, response regulator YesN
MVFIAENEHTENLKCHVSRLCKKLGALNPENNIGPMCSLGSKQKGDKGLLASYLEAKKLLERLFFYNDVFYISNSDITKENTRNIHLKPGNDILSWIEIYDLVKIESFLNGQEENLKKSNLSGDEVKNICIAFIVDVQNGVVSRHPEKELTNIPAAELVNIVMAKNYLVEVFDIVRSFILSLAEAFSVNTSNSTILKVIQYVKTNYKEDLKLETLGELFHSNSAYLGKKFKGYTGVPFNTFLDVVRIDAAKELLKNTDLKIYQISKLVGYSNTDYFFLKFKKHTNMTPKKYQTGTD